MNKFEKLFKEFREICIENDITITMISHYTPYRRLTTEDVSESKFFIDSLSDFTNYDKL